MNHKKTIGEYRLHAMADGELDTHETEALLQEVKENPELQRELCDIHLVKDMLKAAYPLQEKRQSMSFAKNNLFGAIAASLLLLAVGFFAGNHFTPYTLNEPFSLSMAKSQPNKVILYLGTSDEEKFTQTLGTAEKLLQDYSNTNTQVDIVTSAGGIDLLRTQTSAHIRQVSSLANRYDRIAFVACNSTLSKLKSEGKNVDVIDEAVIAPSAVQYIVKRLQQGWSYVAI